MNIIVVDVNRKSHDCISECLRALFPESELMDFYDPLLALKYAVNNSTDVLAVQPKMRLPLVSSIVENMRKRNPGIKFLLFSDVKLRRKVDLNDMPDAVIELPVTEEGMEKIKKTICGTEED